MLQELKHGPGDLEPRIQTISLLCLPPSEFCALTKTLYFDISVTNLSYETRDSAAMKELNRTHIK